MIAASAVISISGVAGVALVTGVAGVALVTGVAGVAFAAITGLLFVLLLMVLSILIIFQRGLPASAELSTRRNQSSSPQAPWEGAKRWQIGGKTVALADNHASSLT